MSLPAPMRRAIRRQCGGDWRRVTLEDDGSILVHNRPQRGSDDPDPLWVPPEPVQRRPDLIPTLPPLPTPLWVTGPPTKPERPDTSGFRHVQLRPTRPTKKRVTQRPGEAQPLPEDPPPAPQPPPAPEPVRKERPPVPMPFEGALFVPKPTPPARPLTARQVELVQNPHAPKKRKKRKGSPRTTKELLGRLLDLGCTYRRVPKEPWANVKYQGVPLGQVHSNDDASRAELVGDYQAMRAAIAALHLSASPDEIAD